MASKEYVEAQFERLEDRHVEYPYRVQVRDPEGNMTNWMNLTWEQAVKIKEILKEG